MSNVDPDWARVLSLSAHEVRNPTSVLVGYLRMLLSDRAGALTAKQRQMLELSMNSCTRLSSVADELSDLAHIEDGTRKFNLTPVDLRAILAGAIAAQPALADREVAVRLSTADGQARLMGDPARLKLAFSSIITALRRELVTSAELHIHERIRQENGATVSWIALGAPERVETLDRARPTDLDTFDEWRGGCGLSLPVARRIIERHGGSLWQPSPDPDYDESQMTGKPWRAAAVAMLPHA